MKSACPVTGKIPRISRGGLDLRTLTATRKGGDSKTSALRAGMPERSPLYLAMTRQHKAWSAMPPKEADKLYGEQLAWVKEWIMGGAPWPDAARTEAIAKAKAWSTEDGITVTTAGGLSPQWTTTTLPVLTAISCAAALPTDATTTPMR